MVECGCYHVVIVIVDVEDKAICGLSICWVDNAIDPKSNLLLRNIAINPDHFAAHHATLVSVLV